MWAGRGVCGGGGVEDRPIWSVLSGDYRLWSVVGAPLEDVRPPRLAVVRGLPLQDVGRLPLQQAVAVLLQVLHRVMEQLWERAQRLQRS